MAGCYDRTSRVGSKARGTRSQFRLSTQSLAPFKCTYPVHLTDVMDIVQSSPTGHQTSGEIVSPSKGTRTRTVREYEQTISELKKENFDLKLRIFLLEEAINKNSRKDKDSSNQDKESNVQVVVELKVEAESLRNELSYKNQLLQDALDQTEKYAADLKDYQDKCTELEAQLAAHSKLPSKQEFLLLQDEKENLLKETENLENLLHERNEELQNANDRIGELTENIKTLEEKVQKSSVAIQGFVYKHYKETEMIPKEIRPVVQTAVQAAKNNDKEQLLAAVKNFKLSLYKIMSVPISEKYVEHETKMKLSSSEKVKYGETLKHAEQHLSVSPVNLNNIEELEDLSGESKLSEEHYLIDLEIDKGHTAQKITPKANCFNEFGNLLIPLPVSSKNAEQVFDTAAISSDQNVICIDSVVTIDEKSTSSEKLNNRSAIKLSSFKLRRESLDDEEKQVLLSQLSDLSKENELLKLDISEKISTISNFTNDCSEFKNRIMHLQRELKDAQLKIKEFEQKAAENKVISPVMCANTQTSVFEMHPPLSLKDKALSTAGQTNNVHELKEEILMLLLTIEEKDKELDAMEKTIEDLQMHIENELNLKEITSDIEYVNERSELRERLALTCSVNQELMKHLQNLEAFMEDLLNQRNLDTSSLENISESSNFISRLSRCLDESLKLSQVLSDHLSLCEGSKLLESGDISLSKDDISVFEAKGSQHLGLSKLSLNTDSYSKSDEGRKAFQPYYQHFNKNAAGTGKRRWSYSAQYNYAMKKTIVEPDNVVVLGTSNNEDLILLLNENGDPADVLIRNNHTLPENRIQNPEVLQTGGQLRRRCWEQNAEISNSLASDKIGPSHLIENVYSATKTAKRSHIWYSHCISSDSDIWSEPDRDVSMQRIGIDVKTSPTALKSPRKPRYKDKRLTDEHSSEKNASSYNSYKVNSWSRRRRTSGSASKRLFGRESTSKRDHKLEKHYSVLTEKFAKLSSFQNQLQNTKELKTEPTILNDICDEVNNVMGYINETIHKLVTMKENARSFSPIMCENCTVLELQIELRKTQKRLLGSEVVQQIQGSNIEHLIEGVLVELDNLEKQLKEPHAVLSSGMESSEAENQLERREQIDSVIIQKEENYMQNLVQELSDKNKMLEEELTEIRIVLKSEKGLIENLKTENLQLSNHVTQLKEDLLDIGEKKRNLTMENSELIQRLTETNKENDCLKDIERNLEQKLEYSNKLCNDLKSELGETSRRLVEMDAKCLKYEEEILLHSKDKEQFIRQLENAESDSLNEKDRLLKLNEELVLQKNNIIDKLKYEEEKSKILEKEINELNNQLISQEGDLMRKLKSEEEKGKLLEKQINELHDQLISETGNLMNKLKSEDEKAKILEKEISKLSERLISQEDDLMKKLKSEEEKTEELEKEISKLKDEHIANNKERNILQAMNAQLENAKIILSKEKEVAKADLLTSSSFCNELRNELRQTYETLQNMEFKCSAYEKELQSSSDIKSLFLENLSNIKSELTLDTSMLNEKCKQFLKEETSVSEDVEESAVEQMLTTDVKKYVEMLSDYIILKIGLFKQVMNTLMQQLENVNINLGKLRSTEESYKSQITVLHSELEINQHKLCQLNDEKDYLQLINDTNEKTIEDKEKSLSQYNLEIEFLKTQLSSHQHEMDKHKFQLNAKDDEITKLQERIFNLQTQMNNLLRKNISFSSSREDSSSSIKETVKDKSSELIHEDSFLSCNGSPKEMQTSRSGSLNESDIASDESKADVSLQTVPQNSSDITEKYVRKIRALQAKLLMSEKRNQILEKEKNDLRENVLAQVKNNKEMCSSLDERDNINKKIVDLESKLEKKMSFIKELKNELYKTCSSLVEKQEEVDKLRQELSEYVNGKLKPEMQHQTFSFDSNVFTKILNLKKYKWELIQAIFYMQKMFYEKRGIHLNHFEKFKSHIEYLYSLQFSTSLCKTGSEPSLNSLKTSDEFLSNDKTLESILVGLELDIECLENLKIFLKRFFLPFVLESSHDDESKLDNNTEIAEIHSLEANMSKTLPPTNQAGLNNETIRKENARVQEFADVTRSYEALRICSEDSTALTSKNKWETTSNNISNRIDFIENILKSLESEFQHFRELDSIIEDSPNKSVAKSLLLKIFDEAKGLMEKSDKLLQYNSALKNISAFKTIAPKSISKQDISDHESLLSDETITLSRSESLSPVSFEELCPVKITSGITTNAKERKSDIACEESTQNHEGIIETYSQKLETAGSSQDSVFHRSHYSSPDLGIESDPNHDSSAPEQLEKEDFHEEEKRLSNKYKDELKIKSKVAGKLLSKSKFTCVEDNGKSKDHPPLLSVGENLHAIGILQEYELLKREVQESLVGIKSVLSRTGDGLHHIAKYTSPRKNLEYSTFKAIKDTCGNIEVCLKEAYKLVNNFSIAPCPTEEEWNALIQQNQEQYGKLVKLKSAMNKQECEFRDALDKLQHAQLLKENMERKISKKLVKTKKIIRRAELKLLENKCQNLPPVPKYPLEESSCQEKLQ